MKERRVKKEKRAKNVYRCAPKIWRGYSEDERLHFNKMYAMMYYNREQFIKEPRLILDYKYLCRRAAVASTFVYQRGKGIEIGTSY